MAQTRTKIAAGGTLAALGALGAVAASEPPAPSASAAATAASVTATKTRVPVEVRTIVVKKVIHRTRRAKPLKADAPRLLATAAPAAPTVIRAVSAPVAAPVVRRAPVPAAAPAAKRPSVPLRTRASGGATASGGSHERDDAVAKHEGGEGGDD